MANRYTQVSNNYSETHFSKAVTGELVKSRMSVNPFRLTTFNGGDIVPIYCNEVLPNETVEMSLDFVIRQTTLLTPTMGQLEADFYAFFVPNRVVNKSWVNVMGENVNGIWANQADIVLAPLFDASKHVSNIQTLFESAGGIPIGSIADHYDLPSQKKAQPGRPASSVPLTIFSEMNDLVFRGYYEIYNEFFRDQNYQAPIPYSKLNVYNDFLGLPGTGTASSVVLANFSSVQVQNNNYGNGAMAQAIYENRSPQQSSQMIISAQSAAGNSRLPKITSPLLKANKMHDYFTSVLPSPQKAPQQVMIPISGSAGLPVVAQQESALGSGSYPPLRLRNAAGPGGSSGYILHTYGNSSDAASIVTGVSDGGTSTSQPQFTPDNLFVPQSALQTLSLSVTDLRQAAGVQQVYELLATGGSRYREYIRSFFGLDVDNPFKDIPEYLGHFRRSLDLYQTAQTSSSEDAGTPQGNLAAFGYTSNGGKLFKKTFVEHGYLHVFCVVRHHNLYGSMISRDRFRRSMLDFYQPQLANISEQPVYLREINPFGQNADNQPIGYQEAWAEYRYEPDRVDSYMRPGVDNSLSIWNYADDYDVNFTSVNANWLKSNTQAVVDRTVAVTSENAPQFKGQFVFHIDKELPMPTYAVPGMDII